MEKKAIVIIGGVAAIACLVIISGAAYAAGGQSFGWGTHGSGMIGPSGHAGSMMGRAGGLSGGMMGGHGGMMDDTGPGNWCVPLMWQCPSSTSGP